MPMPAAWTALFAHSALKNRRSGSATGSTDVLWCDGAVDDRRQRAVTRQAIGEAGQAALGIDADQEELPVTHDPGAEDDGHLELVQDGRGADTHDAVDIRHLGPQAVEPGSVGQAASVGERGSGRQIAVVAHDGVAGDQLGGVAGQEDRGADELARQAQPWAAACAP